MQAPAERGTVEELGGQALGDDRHLGHVAPVRLDEVAALNQVDPQSPEKVSSGRAAHRQETRTWAHSPHWTLAALRPGIHHIEVRDVAAASVAPQEIAARQPCRLDSWKS